MNKTLAIALLVFVFAACAASADLRKSNENTLCIPERYQVPVGEIAADSGYDSNAGADFSLLFSAEELRRHIPAYKTALPHANNPHSQPLYVMLDRAKPLNKRNNMPEGATPLVEASLIRVEQGDIAWTVMQRADDEFVHWGYCTSTFDADGDFDCIRELNVKDLKLSYTIHKANLHLYTQIDQFLLTSVSYWWCGAN